jgi:hypothetical protein
VERLIRDQLEPHLIDAHAMLRLPVAHDPGLQGGCNFAVAQVLLSIVSGVSVTLYDPAALSQKGVSGKKFKQVLVHHYPGIRSSICRGPEPVRPLPTSSTASFVTHWRTPLA